MFKINKKILNDFLACANQEPFKNAYSLIVEVLDDAMKNIISRNPHIKNYKIAIANEAFSGGVTPASSLDVFLMVESTQLELNFKENKKSSFLNGLRYFGSIFKDNFKLFKRKKATPKKIKKAEEKLYNVKNYDIIDFFADVQLQLCKQLYKNTKILRMNNHIRII